MKTRTLLLSMAMMLFMGHEQLQAQNPQGGKPEKSISPTERVDRLCRHMESKLVLDDATAAEFTPLYKNYLSELRDCRQKCAATEKKSEYTDAERIQRMENRFDARQKMLNVQTKYFNKFKKILNAKQLEMLFNHSDKYSSRDRKNCKWGNQQGHKRNGYYGKRYHCQGHGSYSNHCKK